MVVVVQFLRARRQRQQQGHTHTHTGTESESERERDRCPNLQNREVTVSVSDTQANGE